MMAIKLLALLGLLHQPVSGNAEILPRTTPEVGREDMQSLIARAEAVRLRRREKPLRFAAKVETRNREGDQVRHGSGSLWAEGEKQIRLSMTFPLPKKQGEFRVLFVADGKDLWTRTFHRRSNDAKGKTRDLQVSRMSLDQAANGAIAELQANGDIKTGLGKTTLLHRLTGANSRVLETDSDDMKDRDQKLQAREQDQADLSKVLKTIEETLARQAREAEEARKKALLAQQEAEKRRQQEALAAAAAREQAKEPVEPPKKARTTLGPMVSTDGASYGGAFSSARGKLPWPVNGRLLARFGDARGSDARAKWDGVMISANPGTQVRAVHGGRVVFADWLRGAGLLVILDHGNGYLSLYGHNQSLLKSAGDIVKAGEAISTVGDSGGQDAAGLYFAIRQQGRPTDPSQWCRG